MLQRLSLFYSSQSCKLFRFYTLHWVHSHFLVIWIAEVICRPLSVCVCACLCVNKMSKSATVWECDHTIERFCLCICNTTSIMLFGLKSENSAKCNVVATFWLIVSLARIPYIHIEQTHQRDIGWFKATIVSFHAVSQLSDIVLKRALLRYSRILFHYLFLDCVKLHKRKCKRQHWNKVVGW